MSQFDLLPDSILSLSGKAADRLLSLGDGDAALLYLHILRRGSTAVPGWNEARIRAAGDRLLGAKLISSPVTASAPAPAQEPEALPPEYSLADITAALAGEQSFSALADEVERRLGKKLSTPDLKTLFTLYDHLALPPEVILLIVGWCMREVERKYGPGRKPFLSQIRREAFRWARDGVDTAEAAEAHLKKLLSARTREGELARLLDLPNRPLVEREQKYLAAWTEMGFDNEALRLAYEKTVMGTASKSMDWRYMNGILRRWHEKGLHTVAQIQNENRPAKSSPQAGRPIDQSPDRQAREDMERMRRLMQQMKQEQGG
ncbi:MAG: DnaD domain protein [Oscillospiraceae bacterium]|nr:DnaD domain protein [Oscillospiraceae bacterium]